MSRSQSGQRSKSYLSNSSKTTEANLMKLHRKIKHNEKVRGAHHFGSYTQGQGHNRVRGQNHVLAKTPEANLTKFHRKLEHYEKVCRAQELGSYAQGQGHNRVKSQIVPNFVLLIHF